MHESNESAAGMVKRCRTGPARKISAAYAKCFDNPIVRQDIKSGILYAYRLREMWEAEGMVTRGEWQDIQGLFLCRICAMGKRAGAGAVIRSVANLRTRVWIRMAPEVSECLLAIVI
ncbi:MAG: hypothetical protein M0021_09970 [Clostridia bacterium]|nr:hypothetical protein [Clostridia bacterium]